MTVHRRKSVYADSEKRRPRSRKPFDTSKIGSRGPRAVHATPVAPPAPPVEGEVIKRVKVGRLRTISNWRRELSRVYRQMRRGEIPPELGTKLAFVARTAAELVKNEEELEQLRILNAQYSALLHGTPLPALPALAAAIDANQEEGA